MYSKLIGYLFETNAIRVCPKDKPFWYTSGKIGPYYVNTHFLFGSEEKANAFLKLIDARKEEKLACSQLFYDYAKSNYETDRVYRGTIDSMILYIENHLDLSQVDYISGGERRDWFFSLLIADFLKKPHITIFKDMDSVVWQQGASQKIESLQGASVLHIADLITTASSYERAWVPAINGLGGKMRWSLVVVDRLQHGAEVLNSLGVESHALVSIDEATFQSACNAGYIDEAQHSMIQRYMHDSEGSMQQFLHQHPEFLVHALESGQKEAERAKLMLENDFYGVKALLKE